MPHLATLRSPDAVAHAVKAHHQRFRFLAAVQVPDLVGGFGKVHLYGSDQNCTDALIQATTDHAGCSRYGEYEYLPNSVISAMLRQQVAQDPVTAAFERLGLVRPD